MTSTRSAEKLFALARGAQREGRHQDAVDLYQQVAALNPGSYAVQYNLGLSLQNLHRLEEAICAYRRALEIHPGFAEAHTNLANALTGMGDREQAMAHFRHALALQPGLVTAAMNLANLAFEVGRHQESLNAYVQVVLHDPPQEVAWSRLFTLAFALRQKRLAIGLYPRWASQPVTLRQLAAGMVCARLSGDEAAEKGVLKTLEEFPFENPAQEEILPILGNLPYFDVPGTVRRAMYERHARAFPEFPVQWRAADSRRNPGPIRVGWVSADFRKHVMGRILLDFLRVHDRARFEIHLFSVCASRFHDEITGEFRALAAFHDLSQLPDEAAARAIADCHIDILVDFLGHTLGGKPGIFARRPAPIQVSHLGYHGCPGMFQMDYKVTDAIADTGESIAYQLEKPLVLDTCVMPFSHVDLPPDAPAREVLRERHGIGQRMAIGCFMNPIKLSPRCLSAWGKIAATQPDAAWVFSLFDREDEAIVASLMQKKGVRGEQIVFLPPDTDDAALRARYRAVDLVLDTFPYAGGDTTVAALDMNVPVVTLKGTDHASRMGYSVLWHLGLAETIAQSEGDYVRIAVELLASRERCDLVSSRIEVAKRAAPSAHIENHVRSLERAFRCLFERQFQSEAISENAA
jgi:predicted O-linked N-acetylglucosamine transferase (SPINDLY family)